MLVEKIPLLKHEEIVTTYAERFVQIELNGDKRSAGFSPGKGVTLAWRTASETNNFGYHVQKAQSPEFYQTIPGSFVAGHGTTRRAPFDQMRAAGLSYETVGHFYTGRVRAHAIDFVR